MANTIGEQKQQKRAFLVLSVIGLFFLFPGGIFAQTISQEIGLKDVAFSSLNKVACQGCHGESLVDTHHDTAPAVSGACADCHTVSTQPGNVGVALQRDCMVCHRESPHHGTEAAVNKECNSCHDSAGLSDYSTKVPAYNISKVTPTVESCKSCHSEGEVEGVKIVGMKETHHGIGLKDCNACHEGDEEKTTNIRICERCHSVKAIHEVLPHIKKENCAACHGGKK